MAKKSRKNKKKNKDIAVKRIKYLFNLAEKKAIFNQIDLADRYVEIARKISMRYLVKIPKEFKRRYCKHCYSYLLPKKNSRVRVSRGKIILYCKNCKKYTRIPLKKD